MLVTLVQPYCPRYSCINTVKNSLILNVLYVRSKGQKKSIACAPLANIAFCIGQSVLTTAKRNFHSLKMK